VSFSGSETGASWIGVIYFTLTTATLHRIHTFLYPLCMSVIEFQSHSGYGHDKMPVPGAEPWPIACHFSVMSPREFLGYVNP
jgi:hypothetical protein